MSDDGMLSQDQIDALSQGADLSNVNSEEPSGGTSENVDLSAISKAYTILCEQSTTVLSTLLGKEVVVSLGNVSVASSGEINENYGKDHLLLETKFSKGFNGSLYFLISKKDTAILADLMMMGDGKADYDEDHKDAITELVNQIMGSTSTNFNLQLNTECGFDPTVTSDFNPSTGVVDIDQCSVSHLDVNITDVVKTEIILLTPNELGASIASATVSKNSAEVPESDIADNNIVTNQESSTSMPAAEDTGMSSSFEANSMSQPLSQQASPAAKGNIDMLLDVQLQVAIELGQTKMSIKRILELGPGSIVELDRMAGEPVDLVVNNKVVAKGEVVVVDENFGIRIVSLISPEERLKSLK